MNYREQVIENIDVKAWQYKYLVRLTDRIKSAKERALTPMQAAQVIEDAIMKRAKIYQTHIKPQDIEQAVNNIFAVDVKDRTRRRPYPEARAAFAYIARIFWKKGRYPRSYAEIASYLGYHGPQRHSSVIHSEKAACHLETTEPEYKNKLKRLYRIMVKIRTLRQRGEAKKLN